MNSPSETVSAERSRLSAIRIALSIVRMACPASQVDKRHGTGGHRLERPPTSPKTPRPDSARPSHAFSWTASPLTPRTAGAEIQPLRDLPPNPAAPLWPGFSCPLTGGTLSSLQPLEARMPEHAVLGRFGESNVGDHRFKPRWCLDVSAASSVAASYGAAC